MNINKSKVNEDFRFIVEKLKLIIKGFLIPLVYGLPFFYLYSYEPSIEIKNLGAFVFIISFVWITGAILSVSLAVFFTMLFILIERRYIYDSFLFVYIVRRYIVPFKFVEIVDINYDNIKDGYKKFKASNIKE